MLVQILAQATTQGQEGDSYMTFVLMAGVGLVFYFFMIRPQQKKTKRTKKVYWRN